MTRFVLSSWHDEGYVHEPERKDGDLNTLSVGALGVELRLTKFLAQVAQSGEPILRKVYIVTAILCLNLHSHIAEGCDHIIHDNHVAVLSLCVE